MKYLQACDIMSMAYGPTGESASGAIRFCLATYRPIITTKQSIFEEFSRFTYQINNCDSFLIAEAVDKLLCDDRQKYIEAVKSYTKETSWYNTGKKMYDIYCEVLDK